MATKRKPEAAISLEQVIDEMDSWATGRCYCDEPPPGESGVIECTNCAVRRWQRAVRAAAKTVPRARVLKALVDLHGSATLLATGRCPAALVEEQIPVVHEAALVIEELRKAAA